MKLSAVLLFSSLTSCGFFSDNYNYYTEERTGYICRSSESDATQPVAEYSFAEYRCWNNEKGSSKPAVSKSFSRCRMTGQNPNKSGEVWRSASASDGAACSITGADGTSVIFSHTGGQVQFKGIAMECVPAKTGPTGSSISDSDDCSYGAPVLDEAFALSDVACLYVYDRADYIGVTAKDFEKLRSRCKKTNGTFVELYDIDGIATARSGREVAISEVPGAFERLWPRSM